MKTHKKAVSIITLLFFVALMFMPLNTYASDTTDIYDLENIPDCNFDAAGNLTLNITTKNTTQTMKLEIFLSEGYDIEENSVLLNGYKLTTNISGDIKYGGVVNISDKKINCYIFYVQNNYETYDFFIHWTSDIKELLVVTALTEKDYETIETPNLTQPEKIWTAFIGEPSDLEYNKNTIKEIVNYGVIDFQTYEPPVIRKDHTVQYLTYGIIGTIIAILGTIGYMIFTGKKKEEQRHQEFLNKMGSKEELRKKKELESLKKYFDVKTEGDNNEERKREKEDKQDDRSENTDRENAASKQNDGKTKDNAKNETDAQAADTDNKKEQETLLNNTPIKETITPPQINNVINESPQPVPPVIKKPIKKTTPKFLEEITPETRIEKVTQSNKSSKTPSKPKFLEDMDS